MENNNNNNNRPTRPLSFAVSRINAEIDRRINAEIDRLVNKRSQLLRNIADMTDERELLDAEQRKVAEHAMDSHDDVKLYDVATGADGKLIVTLRLTVDFGDDDDAVSTYINAGTSGAVYSADRQIARLRSEVSEISLAIGRLENWDIDTMTEQFINSSTPLYARPINNNEENN